MYLYTYYTIYIIYILIIIIIYIYNLYIDRALLLDKGTNWVYSAFFPKDVPTKIHLSNNSLLLLNSLSAKTVPIIYT